MRVGQSVSAVTEVDVLVLICLHSSYHQVTDVGFVRIALKVFMQNGWDLVHIILLYCPWFSDYSMENYVLPSNSDAICNFIVSPCILIH